jgi:hypothetical protein
MLAAEHPASFQKTGASKASILKKEQGWCLALTIVSTLFPREFGFDFD